MSIRIICTLRWCPIKKDEYIQVSKFPSFHGNGYDCQDDEETTSLLCPSLTMTNSCRSWLKWSPLSSPREHARPQRQFRQRVQRSVQDISNELGAVHFRRAKGWHVDLCLSNLMSCLSNHSCRLWQERRYEEHTAEWTNFCPTCLCHCRWFAGRSAYNNESS